MDLSRQALYLGKKAHVLLAKKRAVIVGIGALGTVAASLLARSGVQIALIDRDVVEASNLSRQLLFHTSDLGKPKASTAARRLQEAFPGLRIQSHDLDLNKDTVSLLRNVDVVLDCTDNFFTRFLINDYCRKEKIPWVHGSAIEEHGYVYMILPGKACFRCVFEERKGSGTCDTIGVLNTATSVIGSLQAHTALKILLQDSPVEGLVHMDLKTLDCKIYTVKKRNACLTCKGTYEYLEKDVPVAHFCGSNKYQFSGSHDSPQIRKLRRQFPAWIFTSNSVIIRSKSREEAIKLHAKYFGH